jgi:hypothetical protein
MKYRHTLLGTFLALAAAGSIQRCTHRDMVCVESDRIEVGTLEFRVVDAVSKLPIQASVSLGPMSNRELFRSAISFRDDGGVRITYVTDQERNVTISADGFESQHLPLSSLKARDIVALSMKDQKEK